MSRLYDRIISVAVNQQLRHWLSSATIVSAKNVGDYCFATETEACDPFKDFPHVAPPWREFFIEFDAPVAVGPPSSRTAWPEQFPRKWGVLCAAVERNDPEFSMVGNTCRQDAVECAPPKDRKGLDVALRDALAQARWLLTLMVFLEYEKGAITGPEWTWTIPVSDTGTILSAPTGPQGALFTFDGPCKSCQTYRDIEERPDTLPVYKDLFAMLLKPVLLALSFAHCRNVTVRAVDPPPKLSRRHEQRHGVPLSRYYVLDIDPMKKVLRSEGGIETVGLKQALHICRGHFKTFDEKPLFGKLRGTYFWHDHVRGEPTQGTISKDYRITSPENPDT